MKQGEVRKYFNPKYYPFGAMSEKVERADAKLWADKLGYQELMGAKIFEMNKAKKEATNVQRTM